MKKLILTLFLASASLVSFAQSSTKTIRIANASPATIGVNIPVGTLVVDVANKNLYLAVEAVDNTQTITTALAAAELKLIGGSVYSVIDEAVANAADVTNGTIIVSNSSAADGAAVGLAASDFKVYVNGSLLLKSAYTFVTNAGAGANEDGIEIAAGIYEYDQVSVVYNTIK